MNMSVMYDDDALRRRFNRAAFGTTFEPGDIPSPDAIHRRGIWTKDKYDKYVLRLQYGKTGYTDPITGVLVTAKEVMATADSKWNEERHCYKYEDVQMLDGTHAKHLLYNLRDVWKIVVHYEMVYDAIKECHTAVRHKKSDVTKKKVKDRYFNISEDLCKIFVKKCPWCTKDEDNQVATYSVPAMSTRSTGFRDSCTACVVDYSAYPIIDGHGEFMNYLLVLRDDETEYTVLRPICSKDERSLLYELSLLFAILGCPKKAFTCAENSDFNSRKVKDLLRGMEPDCVHNVGEVNVIEETVKGVIGRLLEENRLSSGDECENDDIIRGPNWLSLVPNAMAELNKSAYRKVYGMEFSQVPVNTGSTSVLFANRREGINDDVEVDGTSGEIVIFPCDNDREKREENEGGKVVSGEITYLRENDLGKVTTKLDVVEVGYDGLTLQTNKKNGIELQYPRLLCSKCEQKTVFGTAVLTIPTNLDYYDDFAYGTRWWETGILTTFGVLKAHEQHDLHTIFVDSGTPTMPSKLKSQHDGCLLPKSVKSIVTVAMRQQHFVVLEIKLEHCTTVVYDGRSKEESDLQQWVQNEEYILARYGIAKEKSKMKWLLRYYNPKKNGFGRFLDITQEDDYNCGPIACRVLWELLAPGEMDARFGTAVRGSNVRSRSSDKVEDWRLQCIDELKNMLNKHSGCCHMGKRKIDSISLAE